MVRDYTLVRNSYKEFAAALKPTLSEEEIKYKGICEEVGSEFSDLVASYDRMELTRRFAEVEGISIAMSRVAIGEYTKGEFWRNISPTRKARVDRQLKRLSNFYNVLGIDPEDSLVTRIKEVNSNFIYPLE